MRGRPKVGSAARKASAKTRRALAKVPGPSTNPATNLLIMDVALRGASMMFGRAIEKGLLRTRYQREKASDIVKGRGFVHSMAATSAARLATRSVPGFLLITSGLFAKAVIDRSLGPREAVRRGEKALAERAANADDGVDK